MPESSFPLTADIWITRTSAESLTQALVDLLGEDWPEPLAALVALDVALDLCAQYVTNTRRQGDRWGVDVLVDEYVRQMREESWATVRAVAQRPPRGSPLVRRMFLGVVDAAVRRREKPPLGQLRAALLVMGVYARSALQLGRTAACPLGLSVSHRELRRIRTDAADVWLASQSRAMLRRHLEAGGLRHGPNLLHAWRLALVAVALARGGAAALAQARGRKEVRQSDVDEALAEVESKLLADGQLWVALRRTSLVRDITERFTSRRAAVGSLLG